MITVTKETIGKAAEVNSRRRRGRTTTRKGSVEQEEVEGHQNGSETPDNNGKIDNLDKTDQNLIKNMKTEGATVHGGSELQEDLQDIEHSNALQEQDSSNDLPQPTISQSNRLSESDMVDKQDFCVKVIPPENLLSQQYVTVHIQNPHSGQSDLYTHTFQTSTALPPSLPITIIETQPGAILPVQVASVEGAGDGDALPLQVTAMGGMGGHGSIVSNPCISVEELVPVQVSLPLDDTDPLVETSVGTSTTAHDVQSSYVNQLDDFGGTEGDPVLQGTESILKAHAEILQSAQQ